MREVRKACVVGWASASLVAVAVLWVFVVGPWCRQYLSRTPGNAAVGEEGRGQWLLSHVPADVRLSRIDTGDYSNVNPDDYVGAEACGTCHQEQYRHWLEHSHRSMNAFASEEKVRGDFSDVTLPHRGGQARFYQQGVGYRMELTRGEFRRVYEVNQTIGSRFLQFYVGKQLEGTEPPGHEAYQVNHILPFGYWLGGDQWIPTTGAGWQTPDGELIDPFQENVVGAYHTLCSGCHTTYSFGHWVIHNAMEDRSRPRLEEFIKLKPFAFHVTGHLATNFPSQLEGADAESPEALPRFYNLSRTLKETEACDLTVNLGISCEACHLGGRQHAARPKEVKPLFFPAGKNIYVPPESAAFGRIPANLTLTCARCHFNFQQTYAAGMSTYNSAEASDALAGACYSRLTCVTCHNPHKTLGAGWTMPRAEEDSLCIQCHQQYEPVEQRVAHTHHAVDSEGSRCMNCHMPRIVEGLQEVVRTHAIFSPTNVDMIHARQPNACNLCHLEESIQWTVGHLASWYGMKSPPDLLEEYPEPEASAGRALLQSDHTWTRLAAADAYIKSGDRNALAEVLNVLNDPYTISRHIVQHELEKMLKLKLSDLGYQFYLSRDEREKRLVELRKVLLE